MSTQPVKGQATRWSRAALLASLRRWFLVYHEQPRPRDWNSSAAARAGDQRRLARLRAARWPDYRTVLREFSSWDEAWDEAWSSPPERPLRRQEEIPGAQS